MRNITFMTGPYAGGNGARARVYPGLRQMWRLPVLHRLAVTFSVISLSMSAPVWCRESGEPLRFAAATVASTHADERSQASALPMIALEPTGQPGASLEAAVSCMDWQSSAVDIIEGRFLAYGSIPDVRYAMAQAELGLGVVRTAIELSWRVNGQMRAQTLVDATTSGDFAGGVSFYRADDVLIAEYSQCGWDEQGCRPHKLSYRFDRALQTFAGEDDVSRDAQIHICLPVYFESERALRRARP